MSADRLVLGPATIDLAAHEATVDDARVGLTKNEVALLRYLRDHRGEVVSKGRLHVDVFDYAPRVVSRAADFAIHRLRKKLERDPSNPEHLITVPGVGYRLVGDARPESTVTFRSSLPVPLTRFFGRQPELTAADEAIGRSRLVTLVGPAGVGKTRLSIELGRRHTRAEVCFCALAAASDRAALCAAIAHALGVRPPQGDRPVESLAATVAGTGPLLLILDNCEQLVADAAQVTEHLLSAAPELRVVATSRERLRCPGEAVIEVPPLADEATDLFVDRARAVDAHFQGDSDEDRAAIDEIATALDGLPLAIELAAARVAVLSPTEIRDRLAHSIALGPAPRGAPERQQSLDSAIAWSWNLLDPAEQQALAQLTCFGGPFSAAEAEAVLVPSHTVLDHLQGLRDKSLLDPVPGSRPPRFGFLRAVHGFVEARCDDLPGLWTRHAQWIAARTSPFVGRTDPEALRALEDAHAELRVALVRVSGVLHDPELHGRILLACRPAWTRSAPPSDYLGDVAALLETPDLPAELRLRLLISHAQHCVEHAIESDPTTLAEAMRQATRLGDLDLHVRALLARSSLHRRAQRFAEATAALDRIDGLLKHHDPTELHLQVALRRGTLALEQRELPQAGAAFRRALALSSRTGCTWYQPLILANLAALLGAEGRHGAQVEAARQALDAGRDVGNHPLERRALLMLGVALSNAGELDPASAVLTEAIELADASRDWSIAVEASVVQAGIELGRGELEAAETCVRRARALQDHSRAPWHVAYIDLWEALVCWGRWGSLERAHELLSHGAELARGHMPTGVLELESKRLALEAHLDPERSHTIDRELAELADEARVLGRPDLARTIESDRLHTHLGRARALWARREDPSDELDEVDALLDSAPATELGGMISRVVLASALAELVA